MNQSIVIIGGGMGGLFTGAFLVKEGYHVTVLEKNTIIGGGLQCFKRRGELFETGMHILGGFEEGGSLNKICSYLGVLPKLSMRMTDSDAIDSITYLSDGKTYSIPRGKERFVEYLSNEFPDEAENVRRYTDAMYKISEEVNLFYLRHGKDTVIMHSEEFSIPADEFIARYITNPRLRNLLAYMSPMYGGVADMTPTFVHALINVLYINGSSQFEGGSQQLADALREVIEEHGGQVIAGDAVNRIDVVDRQVQAVHTEKGKTYTADWYISDIHPCTLIGYIDENALTKAYRTRLSTISNSDSCFSVYIKFKKDCQPYVNHPRYYQFDDSSVWHLSDKVDEAWPRGFMCITPPAVNQGEWASRMIVNCLMKFDEVRRWEDTKVGHRGAEYEAWKSDLEQRIIDRLESVMPGFKETVEFSFASSPLTIRDYYGTKEGSMYGFQCDCHNILQSLVTIGTKVKNLLLTGQNVNLHGICGVPLTAIEVTECFVGRGVIIDKINGNK